MSNSANTQVNETNKAEEKKEPIRINVEEHLPTLNASLSTPLSSSRSWMEFSDPCSVTISAARSL